MQRSVATAKSFIQHRGRNLRQKIQIQVPQLTCDVFINHCGIGMKRNVSGLLGPYLGVLGHRPFLDSKSTRPRDLLFRKINEAICGCKVGVAVFSPCCCESPYCLHELAALVENGKTVIPIFCDVKPSELQLVIDRGYSLITDKYSSPTWLCLNEIQTVRLIKSRACKIFNLHL